MGGRERETAMNWHDKFVCSRHVGYVEKKAYDMKKTEVSPGQEERYMYHEIWPELLIPGRLGVTAGSSPFCTHLRLLVREAQS